MPTPSDRLREPLKELTACGLPEALEVMGERWSFMILRASFNRIVHFEVFLAELGIARNILSNRLARLVAHNILDRVPCPDDGRKIEYHLTPKGVDLLPALLALRQWGMKYGNGVAENPVLVDTRDRLPIGDVVVLAHDGRTLEPRDFIFVHPDQVGVVERADVHTAIDMHPVAANTNDTAMAR